MQNGNKEYWIDMRTLPHLGFVDVTDGKNGVAFVNNSLTEYELKQDGTLALTLLKAVKKTVKTYISFYKKPEKAYIVSLNENREKEIDITKPLEVAKHKILTLEFDI